MKILVCVKQVPDTSGKVAVNDDGTLNRASMPVITNPDDKNAVEAALKLKDEYGIWICPNGGDLKDKVFRVGHIGCLTEKDFDCLLDALADLQKKGFI